MKTSLLWAFPFAARLVLAVPAPEVLLRFGTDEALKEGKCTSSETGGNILSGSCSNEPTAGQVLYTTADCNGAKCSVRSPRCFIAGSSDGTCMTSRDVCLKTDSKNGLPGKPGTIVQSDCYEQGILCCNGQVETDTSPLTSFDTGTTFPPIALTPTTLEPEPIGEYQPDGTTLFSDSKFPEQVQAPGATMDYDLPDGEITVQPLAPFPLGQDTEAETSLFDDNSNNNNLFLATAEDGDLGWFT